MPPAPQITRVCFGKTKIAAYIAGEGTPLVLLHGFPLDRTMWQHQVEQLSQHATVIVPDLPGFGESETEHDVLTMSQLADDLADMLEMLECGVAIHLCGLSMGGYVALEFWNRHPEKLNSLILCDTRAEADSEEGIVNRQKVAKHVLEFGAEKIAEGMIAKLFASSTYKNQSELVSSVQEVISNTAPKTIAAASLGMADRCDFTSRLEAINVPVLGICGEDDTITPLEEMRLMTGKIPGAKCVAIPDAGHMSPMENPEAVNNAISEFLAQTEC